MRKRDELTDPKSCMSRARLCRTDGVRIMKPILVGEQNPYGADPYYALYPAPDGCSGHRLCRLILGMSRKSYLEAFDRVNLCDGPWSMPAAKVRAEELIDGGLSGGDEEQPLILFGAKVAKAFGVSYKPFEQFGEDILVLPHPSGLCRLWGEAGAFERARQAVALFAPEVAHLLGVSS